jgi:hypothetical protein
MFSLPRSRSSFHHSTTSGLLTRPSTVCVRPCHFWSSLLLPSHRLPLFVLRFADKIAVKAFKKTKIYFAKQVRGFRACFSVFSFLSLASSRLLTPIEVGFAVLCPRSVFAVVDVLPAFSLLATCF